MIKKLALLAIKKDGRNVQWLSNELKNDKEIALKSVEQRGKNIKYLSNNLKADKDVILSAISIDKQYSEVNSKPKLIKTKNIQVSFTQQQCLNKCYNIKINSRNRIKS